MKPNLKEIISIANNVVNPPDADKLKTCIYDLQQENIDLNSANKELMSQLQIYQEWSNTKSLYKEHQTPNGSIVYVKVKEDSISFFYCPVCFDKKSIIPL